MIYRAIKGLKHIRLRLWWVEVLFPIMLIFSLFFGFSFVMYSGQKHLRLSSFAEDELLKFSLLHAEELSNRQKKDENVQPRVFVISGKESDFETLNEAPTTKIRDVSVTGYAKVLEKVGQGHPSIIVLSWNPSAHPSSDEYYKPLIETVTKLPKEIKVLIAYPKLSSFLPRSLTKLVLPVSDTQCDDEVQMLCPYDERWTDWVLQALFRELVVIPKSRFSYVVSSNVPREYPSYIANLKRPESIPTYSFLDILDDAGNIAQFKGGTVFIGSDIAQLALDKSQLDLSRRILTMFDDVKPAQLRFAGTPFHVFWAQVVQMFYDDAFVALPPFAVSVGFTLLFCVIVLLVWRLFGGLIVLGVFIFFVVAAPFINAATIHALHCYIPLFDTYFFGFVTLIISSFVGLSSETLESWRIQERRRISVQTADLKGNFISLLSHNLNTPIAKMQGMLKVLESYPLEQALERDLMTIQGHTAELEMLVKAVLLSTSVEEGAVHHTPITLPALKDEFIGLMGSLLKRMGLQVEVLADAGKQEYGEAALAMPIKIDPKVICSSIAGALILLIRDNDLFERKDQTSISLQFTLSTPVDDVLVLNCMIDFGNVVDGRYQELLKDLRSLDQEEQELPVSFFKEVLLRFLRAVLKTYEGQVSLFRRQNGASLVNIKITPQP